MARNPRAQAAIESLPKTELEVKSLGLKVEQLSIAIDKLTTKGEAQKSDSKTPWYTFVIQFIGLPAAVLAVFIQFNQVRDAGPVREKTVAETQQVQVQTLKTQAELQQLLDSLSEKKAEGIEAYKRELAETAPKIQSALDNLKALQQTAAFPIGQQIIVKFVIIWALYHGTSLIVNIITTLWNSLISASVYFLFARIPRKFQSLISIFAIVVGNIPSLFQWAISVLIFSTVVVPFLFQIVPIVGTTAALSQIMTDAWALNLGRVVEGVRGLLGL